MKRRPNSTASPTAAKRMYQIDCKVNDNARRGGDDDQA